ncbi:MAG: DUF167 domain-containing protein [Acidobacteriota bacterium]
MSEKDGAVIFRVRVQPRASKSEAAGEYAGALRLRLAAPPVDNKANEECRRFLARALDVPPSAVEIVSGLASRDKLIRVRGVALDRVRAIAE